MNSNGTTFQVDEHAVAPKKVWEFTDNTFQNVLARERAEHSLMQQPTTGIAASMIFEYRGIQDSREPARRTRTGEDLQSQLLQRIHSGLNEVVKDIIGVENGTGTNFAKTFEQEYTRMRAENSLYRETRTASEMSESEDRRLKL